MEIGPIDHGGHASTEPDRARQASNSIEHRSGGVLDSVEISLKARALLAEAADESRVEDAKTASNRLELIRERVASGHYDKAEIIEVVAERLTDQMY